MPAKALILAVAVAMLSGCATQKMSGDQLARVAKDWSLGIRASQIIPVYPLTEDLQPGDVFLVADADRRAGSGLSRQRLSAAGKPCHAAFPAGLRPFLSRLAAHNRWRRRAAAPVAVSQCRFDGCGFLARADRGVPDLQLLGQPQRRPERGDPGPERSGRIESAGLRVSQRHDHPEGCVHLCACPRARCSTPFTSGAATTRITSASTNRPVPRTESRRQTSSICGSSTACTWSRPWTLPCSAIAPLAPAVRRACRNPSSY